MLIMGLKGLKNVCAEGYLLSKASENCQILKRVYTLQNRSPIVKLHEQQCINDVIVNTVC